jgi:serine phosphatase RsbU (regulator of sigma subunit)
VTDSNQNPQGTGRRGSSPHKGIARPISRGKTTPRAAGVPQTPSGDTHLAADVDATHPQGTGVGNSASSRQRASRTSGVHALPKPGSSASRHKPAIGGLTHHAGDQSESDAPSEGASRKHKRGDEIGHLQRRGLSLGLKISGFTLVVITAVTALFGYVSITSLQDSLNNQIKRSGYNSIMNLHAFGQHVIQDIRGERNIGLFNDKVNAYRKNNADDLKYIKQIKDSDHRIQDVAIFVSSSPENDPNLSLLQATDTKAFASEPAGAGETIDGITKAEFEKSGVKIFRASYGGQMCLWFKIPLEADTKTKGYYSTAVLVLSASQINEQVSSVFWSALIAGVIFIAMGLLASLWLASRISHPVRVLVSDVNTVAAGDLTHESTVPNITKDEIGLLAMAFNRMTRALRVGRDAERETERMASEINTARAIHERLIPEKCPVLPGLDIFSEYKCAKEVGGDYYDFIPVGDTEHISFCVADVSGKGIPGSMVMGTTRTYLRMMSINNLSPMSVLSKTNYYIAREIKRGMFVTCVYAMLNLRTREMTLASAGHNPILIWRAATKTIEKPRPAGIALGFDKGPIFDRTAREIKIKLLEGDRVVMYTDGVVECMNEQRDEWTDEALDAFTLQHADKSSQEYVELLKKTLEDHQGRAEQHDDITIVTFRVVAAATSHGKTSP